MMVMIISKSGMFTKCVLGTEKKSETCRQEVLEHFDAPDAADKHFVIELVNWFFFFFG